MISVEKFLRKIDEINHYGEYNEEYPEIRHMCEQLQGPIRRLYNAMLENELLYDDADLNESHGNKRHNDPKTPMAAMKHGEWEKRKDYVGDGFKSNGGAHKNNKDKRQEKVSIRNYEKYIDEAVNESINKFKKGLLK